MFYESRFNPPPLGEAFRPAGELFSRGESREAHAAVLAVGEAGPVSPEDVLFRGDLLRAVGLEEEFHATIVAGARLHPSHFLLRFQLARIQCMKDRLLAAERTRASLVAPPGREDLVRSLEASILAQSGRAPSARRVIATLENEGALSDPLVAYEVGYAELELREWKKAVELFRATIARCPSWPRPRILLYRALSALGQLGEAREEIERAAASFPSDISVALTHLGELYFAKEWKRVVETVAVLFPVGARRADAGPPRGALGLETRALWHLGEFDRAIASARALDPAWGELLATRDRKGKRCTIPVPPLTQDKNACVASSVAMALRPLGRTVDPAVIFKEMGGAEGIASWQLDRWLRSQGFEPVDVPLALDAIRGLLDRGHTLLATRARILMSHMELVVGYDDSLQEVEALDPAVGLPHHVPYENLVEEYGEAGEVLIALVPAGEVSSIPAAWRDTAATRCREIVRAIYDERIPEAQALLRELDPAGLDAARLKLRFQEALLPAEELEGVALALVVREDADTQTRLGAAMCLNGLGRRDEGNRALQALRKKLNPFFRSFLRVLEARERGQWARTLKRCELLLERAAPLHDLWIHRAAALEGAGRFEEAAHAREICLEIEPEDLEANMDSIRRTSHLALDARLARVKRLLTHHPRSPELLGSAGWLSFELGHPTEGEELFRRALRLNPFSPGANLNLRNFFLMQGREDLAPPLAQARADGSSASAVAKDVRLALRLAAEEVRAGKAGPALAQLHAARERGTLTPHEELDVRTLDVRLLLEGEHSKEEAPVALRELLPASVPAPRARSVAWLLTDLPMAKIGSGSARVLLDWAHHLLEGEALTPEARFECAAQEELAGLTASAARTYEELAREGLAAAHFRLGIIALRQENLTRAREHLERCIEREPAHVGSWEFLARIAEQLGDEPGRARSLETLVRLVPYDAGHAHRLLAFRTRRGATREARAWLSANGQRYRESFRQWWTVQFLIHESQWKDALAAIGPALIADNARDALGFELECYQGQGVLKEKTDRIREGLEKYPGDGYFNHLLAEHGGLSRDEARRRYETGFLSEPSSAIAIRIIELAGERELVGILDELLARADPARHDELLVILRAALSSTGRLDPCRELLEKVVARNPHELVATELLIEACAATGRFDESVPHGKRLLGRDPENPKYLWFCAYALQESRPAEALPLFLKHHDLTGDPESLTASARCHQLAGDARLAIDLYWKSLALRAGDPLALTNLFLLHEPATRLVNACNEVLSNAPRADAEYFAVAAVKIALGAGEALAPTWEAWALERARAIEEGARGLGAERSLLRSMLHVWCRRRGARHRFREVYGRERFYEAAFLPTRRWWWKRLWIPAT